MSLTVHSGNLRDRQISNLKKMLHLNIDTESNLLSSNNSEELIWKVLVLDNKSTSIVSSVLRINDLLDYGITMHSLINQRRAALPDVPVIYFVEPTVENITKIISDLENDQYDEFYINFTSSLNRSLLEEFAKKVALAGKSDKIKQVFDQYLDFIVTEPNLFSLELPELYYEFNNPQTTEEEIASKADAIANGLFSTILTMGSVPVIRCNRNGPAELVSQRLDQKLRDHLINTKSFPTATANGTGSNADRLVLVLLDRNIDLATMFAHSWIYQCMVSDVFSLHRNTIEIKNKLPNDRVETKRFDIDPKDFFWNANSSLPFPDAVENVQNELNKYTEEAKEITAKTGYSSIKDIDPNDQHDTQHIQEAIKALPELTQRKNIIDIHMTVLTDLIKELESKNLDAFFEVEQNSKDPKTQREFIDLLKSTSKENNLNDKLRTYLILTLTCDLPKSFADECESILASFNIDLKSVDYIKKVKEITKMSSLNLTDAYNSNQSSSASSSTNYGNQSALFSSLSSKLIGLTEGGSSKLQEGFGSLVSGIKNLLPAKSNLPITNIVESIMNPNNANQESIKLTDDYLYFDPNIKRGSHSKQPKRSTYNESLVFVIGGGNYLEYSNLQDWCNSINEAAGAGSVVGGVAVTGGNVATGTGSLRQVFYGSTKIVTADEFIGECGQLGGL